MTELTDAEQEERSVAVTLGEVLAGLPGMAEMPGMPELAEMPPAGFTFQIPPCQRPYCWKLSDIEHVLADVADMRSSESTTPWYFGPICFCFRRFVGRLDEIVMLGRNDNRMYTDRFPFITVFNGHL